MDVTDGWFDDDAMLETAWEAEDALLLVYLVLGALELATILVELETVLEFSILK